MIGSQFADLLDARRRSRSLCPSRTTPPRSPALLDTRRRHPQYAERFVELLRAVPAEVRDRFLFGLAARQADDIRRYQTCHRSPWHYINFPYGADNDDQFLVRREAYFLTQRCRRR